MKSPSLIVGVLDLQGAVSEHLDTLNNINNIKAIAVKSPEQIAMLDGLIIPGGESTAIGRLIKQNELLKPIQTLAKQGKPILGTCAGLVLCGMTTTDNKVEQLKLIDIEVERNGFGRQVNSFETVLNIDEVGNNIPAVFIRAPYISEAGKAVKLMSFVDGRCVMAQQNNILVCSFHPELTQDNRIINYFINLF